MTYQPQYWQRPGHCWHSSIGKLEKIVQELNYWNRSVDAARNAVDLWEMLSTRESAGHLAGLRDLISDCLAIVGERQTDNDRLLQAADLRIQAYRFMARNGVPGGNRPGLQQR